MKLITRTTRTSETEGELAIIGLTETEAQANFLIEKDKGLVRSSGFGLNQIDRNKTTYVVTDVPVCELTHLYKF